MSDGVDTDTAADWVIGNFFLSSANTPVGGGLDGCAPLLVTIPESQGGGQRSPFEGEAVITHGVVTLYSSNRRDFWMQDPDGDGDPATSDGIVVDDGGFLPGPPEVGDVIEIAAVVQEQQFGDALPLTRLDAPSAVTILSTGNPLPEPVRLNDLPNESIVEGIDFGSRSKACWCPQGMPRSSPPPAASESLQCSLSVMPNQPPATSRRPSRS